MLMDTDSLLPTFKVRNAKGSNTALDFEEQFADLIEIKLCLKRKQLFLFPKQAFWFHISKT